MTRHRLTFITPLFSKGSYEDRPEIRPSSIRGQLHWWFRALGGKHSDEKAIFGGIGKPTAASKVVVRVANVQGQTGECATLPHKRGGQAGPKWAYKAGTSFELMASERLGGLDEPLRTSFYRAFEAWLLLGTLGLRSTRAGGSFFWTPTDTSSFQPPEDFGSYATRVGEVLRGASIKAVLLRHPFASAEEARITVSDTLGGRNDHTGETDLAKLRYPLGNIFKGRKTSPVRFRIVKIANQFHVAAIWDDRRVVTGNNSSDLNSVIDLLAERGKNIGKLLQGQF